MQRVANVDPFKCRVWPEHSRSLQAIDERSCAAEIESFKKYGQLVPALGRHIEGDCAFEVELVYGARRLFAARLLNKPILVEIRPLSDREAIVAMEIENRLRQEVSAYERGLCYARVLRMGLFASQEDLARDLELSSAQLSRLLQLATLPAAIVGAFKSARDIRETWGLEIVDVLRDPASRNSVMRTARGLSRLSSQLSGRDVFRRLVAARSRGGRPRRRAGDRIVLSVDGQPLFRIRQKSRSIALILPSAVSPERLQAIETDLVSIMERSATH